MKQQNLHLFTHALCPYVQRSVIVLEEKRVPYLRTDIDLANKPEWFKQISPLGKVPVLTIEKKQSLFESAVICEYLDETTRGSLHPADPLEKAYHRAWIEFGSGLLNSIGALYNAKDAASFENKRVELLNKFQLVENEISGTPFFSGGRFHLVDAVYAPIFRYFEVFDLMMTLAIFEEMPKVNSWRSALQQRRSVHLAVTPEYPERLLKFLRERDSYISSFALKVVV